MTADELLTVDHPVRGEAEPADELTRKVELVRSSFALLEPRIEEVGQHFYATLFSRAPQVRDLFPVTMQVQRSRLLRAVVHVVQMIDRPDELRPFLEQLGRDHRKFGVMLPQQYQALGAALVDAIATFSGDAWSPELEQAWVETYQLASAAMRDAAEAEPGPAYWQGQIVGHRRIGWDLAVITVRTPEPIPYRAGQYLSVETPQRPRLWRYLSPANAPRPDGVIEFHVRAVEGGWVSRAMVAHSRVGDTWRIGPPLGRMTVDPDAGRDLLLVAGGTGAAPMKAVLEDLDQRTDPPHTQVFVGGRTWEDLYAFEMLRALSYSNTWLDVVPVVEDEPEDGSGAERGTLADVVSRYGAWPDHDVLVCGSPAMIRATVSRMLVAGTPLDRIRYDPFTMD